MLDNVDYALSKGMDIITHFETFFDIKFPLPKQDMYAIPDFSAGAMENWGLITYRWVSTWKLHLAKKSSQYVSDETREA